MTAACALPTQRSLRGVSGVVSPPKSAMPISEEPRPSTNCEPGSAASSAASCGSSHGLIRPAGRSPSCTSRRMWP